MVNDPQELILEHLRAMRADLSSLKEGMTRVEADIRSLRREVNGLRGELLRQEESLALVAIQVDRINARLGLNEPQQ